MSIYLENYGVCIPVHYVHIKLYHEKTCFMQIAKAIPIALCEIFSPKMFTLSYFSMKMHSFE